MRDAGARPDSPVHAADVLDAHLRVETPERVEFDYELAGLGSRLLAGSFDLCILVIVWTVLLGVVLLIPALVGELDRVGAQTAFLVIGGVASAVTWGYFLVLEWAMGGQTPGKRIMRLRVVSVDGGSAPASALLVRNLVRVADLVPPPTHLVGALCIFVTPRCRRLGDLAAGTGVVRERTRPGLLGGAPEPATDAQERFPPDEVDLVRSYLRRRGELLPEPRERIGAALLARIEARTGPTRLEPDDLLRQVAAGRSVSQLRGLAAPAAVPSGAAGADEADETDRPEGVDGA